MKLKSLLIAVMALFATAVMAQEQTAYAVWCAGSDAEGDIPTLYFLAADAEPAGEHNGQTITEAWSGTDVTASTTYLNPAWNWEVMSTLKRVVFEESFKDVRPTSCYSWFHYCENLTEIKGIANLNTSAVTSMQRMFYYCSALKELDLSSFDTGNVIYMDCMFDYCSALKSLDLSNFDTRNVTDMRNMFSDCSTLESLDLSSFDTGNVSDLSFMFFRCSALKSLDLRKADKAVDMLKTNSEFAKRGMAIYLPADADVSDAVLEENYVIKPGVGTSFARTFTADKMSTVCLPFAVDVASVESGTFYDFKGLNDGKTVKFGKLASGSTVADRAYLFKPSTGDKVTFTGEAIGTLPELAEGAADGLYGVYEMKVFTPEEADLNIYYGWSEGNFVSIGDGATVNPGRAYLKVAQVSGAKHTLKAVFDDDTTGISEVDATDGGTADAPAYDPMGRRVGDSYRGVVIKNGKKMVR